MTAADSAAIDRLRDELHGYHLTVVEHITRCESCRADVGTIKADLYGNPGDKESSPGVMGDVADLKLSRGFLRWSLRAIWVGLVAIAGLLVELWGHTGK